MSPANDQAIGGCDRLESERPARSKPSSFEVVRGGGGRARHVSSTLRHLAREFTDSPALSFRLEEWAY